MPTGPAGMLYDRVDAIEGNSPMILKAMLNTSTVEKFRFSSCLYPRVAVHD